jgi:hypothetical protein
MHQLNRGNADWANAGLLPRAASTAARLGPARCFALRASQIRPRHPRQNNTTGKSAKPVQSFAQKYSTFAVGQITDLNPRVSPDERGVAHVTNAR